MAGHEDERAGEIEALRNALDEQRRVRRQLLAAKADEDHQARRLKDVMERHGGRHADAEANLSLLDEGRRLTAEALARSERDIADLERRLAALDAAP